jgi:hypothetical protein
LSRFERPAEIHFHRRGDSARADEPSGRDVIHTGQRTGLPDSAFCYPFAETEAPHVFRRSSGEGQITGGTIVHVPEDPSRAQAAVDRAPHRAFAGPAVAPVHARAVEYDRFQYEMRSP